MDYKSRVLKPRQRLCLSFWTLSWKILCAVQPTHQPAPGNLRHGLVFETSPEGVYVRPAPAPAPQF